MRRRRVVGPLLHLLLLLFSALSASSLRLPRSLPKFDKKLFDALLSSNSTSSTASSSSLDIAAHQNAVYTAGLVAILMLAGVVASILFAWRVMPREDEEMAPLIRLHHRGGWEDA